MSIFRSNMWSRILSRLSNRRSAGAPGETSHSPESGKPAGRLTLVFVTIGRNDSVKRLIDSVREYFPELKIIAADQNAVTEDMAQFYASHDVGVLWLPFDCGLGFARNRAVESADTPYVLLADDDFIFTHKTTFEAAIDILDSEPELGFIGGSLIDIRIGSNNEEKRLLRRWEKFFVIEDRIRTLITVPIDYVPAQAREVDGHKIYLCDMTSNWGVFRRKMFEEGFRWDEGIKINGEHEDFFLNLKVNSNWRVAYFPPLQCDHRQPRIAGYSTYRQRQEGRRYFGSKWKFTHHLELGVGLRSFADYLDFREVPLDCPDIYDPEGLGNVEFAPGPSKKITRPNRAPPNVPPPTET